MHGEESSIFLSILIVCGIFAFILIVLGYIVAKQHRRNISLYKSKLKAEISAMENERGRIAADLHDDLGPLLSAIKHKITPGDVTGKEAKDLLEAGQYIDDVLAKIRLISNNLLPHTLRRKGLLAALSEFADFQNDYRKTRIELVGDAGPLLSEEQAVNLFRAAVEVIHNALKYAYAEKIIVTFQLDGKDLLLIIADDGRGFNVSNEKSHMRGRGLVNIENRIDALNGKLYLDSSPGTGTRYEFQIPLATKTL